MYGADFAKPGEDRTVLVKGRRAGMATLARMRMSFVESAMVPPGQMLLCNMDAAGLRGGALLVKGIGG